MGQTHQKTMKMACLSPPHKPRKKHTNRGTHGPTAHRSRLDDPQANGRQYHKFEFPSRGQISRQAKPQSIPESSLPPNGKLHPGSSLQIHLTLGSNGRRRGAVPRRRRPHGLLVDSRRGEPCAGLRQPRPRRGGRPAPGAGSFAAGGGGVYDSRVRAARRHVRPQDGRLPLRCRSCTFPSY